ncbi:330_t:CDS:10 [Ambispora leptoticha]|uniref:330_t:CDS:1 n=1 Tax=Ambispora leptoticha TaxID=144679 RepID=A0A9N9B9R9_9GLOM|nr:330_t:CDS:10 [Ambispora leptoticha]
MPSLIIVDGGKEQVKAVQKALKELKLSIITIGLVKNENHRTEKIITNNLQELEFGKQVKMKNFLTNCQEEVHRYALQEGDPDQKEALANHKKALRSAIDELKAIILSKNDWSKTALLIIDMQEGFSKQARKMKIIDPLQKVIAICRQKKIPIIWTQHGHRDLEKDELNPKKEELIIGKTRSDAFVGTNLENYLKELADCEAASTEKMQQASLLNLGYGYGVIYTADQLSKGIEANTNENRLQNLVEIMAIEKKMKTKFAATSLKPKTVIQAISNYYENYSINTHSEGSSFLAQVVRQTVQQTRQLIAQKINARKEEIIFFPSTTYSLNILALSLKNSLQKGDKIFLTHLEHSSNCYPWQAIAQEREVQVDFLPLTKNFVTDIDKLEKCIDKKTKIVSFSHMSNSLGTINPVAKITQKIKEINPNCLVIIDACQKNDFLLPLTQKFEVGTLPLAQIFGLKASFEFLNNLDIKAVSTYEKELKNYAINELEKLEKVTIYNKNLETIDIVLFNLQGYHAHDVADYLGRNNILVRAEQVQIQKGQLKKLGLFTNYEKYYLTLNKKYEAEQIRVFGEMVKKGLIYQGFRPIYWSCGHETALAEAEIEYLEKKDTSLYFKIKLADNFFGKEKKDNKRYIVDGSDFIEEEEGTGIVHLAPAFGVEDFAVAKKEKLTIDCPLEPNGLFNEKIGVPELVGKHYSEVNKYVITDLEKRNLIVKKEATKKELLENIEKTSVIGFAAYGVYKLLESLEEKDKVKVKEVFKTTQEGSVIKKNHLVIKEYCSRRD